MQVNETWSDGSCKRCKCYARKPTEDCPGKLMHGFLITSVICLTPLLDKPPESSCSVKSCDTRQMKKDKFKYVLEEIRIPGVCCTEYKKTACKQDGNIKQVRMVVSMHILTHNFKIGETWISDSNICKKYSCVEKDGEAKMEYNLEKCTAKCSEVSLFLFDCR